MKTVTHHSFPKTSISLHIRILLLAILLLLLSEANSQNFSWAKQFGGSPDCYGVDIKTDAGGNVYSTGYMNGVADFDPGPGVYNLGQVGGAGMYVSKLNVNGDFVWARQFESWNIISFAIDLDASGNVYTTGFFQQNADFDPGPGTYTLNTGPTGSHGYVCKLNNNGNFIWAKQFGGNGNFYLSIYDQFIDGSGNVLITGYFTGTADFDPGPSVLNFTSAGLDDHFIVKLDPNGNLLWARHFAGTSFSEGHGITVDAAGNVYSTGFFQGTVDFDPGAGIFNLSSPGFNSPDFFISKLDANGNLIWAKQVTGAAQGTGTSLVVDAANVYVTGFFRGTADFDPGSAAFNMTPVGGIDMFLMKLDNNGGFQWAKQIGSSQTDQGKRISLGASGDIYVGGYFENSADFDPGPGITMMASFGSYDAFFTKFDNNGNLLWAKQAGGTDSDICYSIATDAQENIYATGIFNHTADFDPGPGTYNLTPQGGDDAFVLKLSRCTNITTSTLTVTACNSYTLNGQVYSSSGVYGQTLLNSAGCDSIITLNLTIGGSVTNLSANACDSYVWEGQTYTSSGSYSVTYPGAYGCDSVRNLNLVIRNRVTNNLAISICEGQSYSGYTSTGIYTDTYTGSNGCDSIRVLNLTVKPIARSSISAIICEGQSYNGYTTTGVFTDTYVAANGCDSIRTLQLTVNPKKFTSVNAGICEGQSYFAGGQLQTSSGIYRDTLQTSLGCDSIITTNLTINPKPRPDLGPDLDLCAGNSINLDPGNFSSYLWQDLSTSSVFNTNTTGLYWVTVRDNNNCTATDSVRIKNIFPLPSNFLKATDSVCSFEKLFIQSLNNYNSYLWSNGSRQNNITVQLPGDYWLRVTDINGCTATDTIIVTAKKCKTGVFIPTAFSPNNDGKNDVFKATVSGKLVSFRLQVYDRSGQVIFQTTNPQQGWNGLFKKLPYSTTVFVWQCGYQFEGEKAGFQKGNLLLIR